MDDNTPATFRDSEGWKEAEGRSFFVRDEATGRRLLHSLSGYERNCLFLNRAGKQFKDVSLISGLDNISDGRSFVYWDYDRDGWQDIALVNANAPLLSFYRNSIGDAVPAGGASRVLALRYRGANRSASPLPGTACRDGYGARVEVDLDDAMKLEREYRCGEGFAAQNSATMIIGIGGHDRARSVTVRWPSGKAHTIENVPHGMLLTAYEDAVESPDGSGFEATPYLRAPRQLVGRPAGGRETSLDSTPVLSLLPTAATAASAGAKGGLRLYTTMATWCAACRSHLPQVATLRSAFAEGQLKLYGVPIDVKDTVASLKNWDSSFDPAYQLLVDVTRPQKVEVQKLILDELGSETLPSTIVTDGAGRVLRVLRGIPTVSDVRRWMGER